MASYHFYPFSASILGGSYYSPILSLFYVNPSQMHTKLRFCMNFVFNIFSCLLLLLYMHGTVRIVL